MGDVVAWQGSGRDAVGGTVIVGQVTTLGDSARLRMPAVTVTPILVCDSTGVLLFTGPVADRVVSVTATVIMGAW